MPKVQEMAKPDPKVDKTAKEVSKVSRKNQKSAEMLKVDKDIK